MLTLLVTVAVLAALFGVVLLLCQAFDRGEYEP